MGQLEQEALAARCRSYLEGHSLGWAEGAAVVLAGLTKKETVTEVLTECRRTHPRILEELERRDVFVDHNGALVVGRLRLGPPKESDEPRSSSLEVGSEPRLSSLKMSDEPRSNGPTDVGGYREESGWRRAAGRQIVDARQVMDVRRVIDVRRAVDARRVVDEHKLFALSLWRPWGDLIVDRRKDVENRGWAPGPDFVGATIAIHSAVKVDKDAMQYECPDGAPWPALSPPKHIIGLATIEGLDAPRNAVDSPWRDPAQWGWRLSHAVRLARPIAIRGAQKLWRVPRDVAEQVLEQVRSG